MSIDLQNVRFINDEMTAEWYNGNVRLHWLCMRAERLRAIHANAFNQRALRELQMLVIDIEEGTLTIHDAAFYGMFVLERLGLEVNLTESLPVGLFDSFTMARIISFIGWPRSSSLNEIFGNIILSDLLQLYITDIVGTPSKFRVLDASNFTFFPRLTELVFINCGIEVINDHTFDDIGRTLTNINLNENRIEVVALNMFLVFLESHAEVQLSIFGDISTRECECSLIELVVMANPIDSSEDDSCIECVPTDDFDAVSCGLHHVMSDAKFCIGGEHQRLVQFIRIRMAYWDNFFTIQTNFTQRFRLILVNVDGLNIKKCSRKLSKTNFKCFKVDRFTNQFELCKIDEICNAEMIFVTATLFIRNFGVSPMHSITVRPRCPIDNDQLDSLILTAMLVNIVGLLIGFGSGASIQLVRELPRRIVVGSTAIEATPNRPGATEKRPSYDYPLSTITLDEYEDDTNYDEITEYIRI